MEAFEYADLAVRRAVQGRPYLEFLRHDAMSAGLYVLPVGASDPQQPHTEDELYSVVRGRAKIRVADEVRDVQAGSLVYVAAGVPHRFEDIAEELAVLVIFAPAEYSRAARSD